MPNARKPAITGLAKPHGIVDDVLVPLSKKVTKRIGQRKAAKTAIVASKKRHDLGYMVQSAPVKSGKVTPNQVATALAKDKSYAKRTSRKQVSQYIKNSKGK
jgi:hypothetical protein